MKNFKPALEPVILFSVIAFVVMIWGFFHIAEEMAEGDTNHIDTFILTLMRNPLDRSMPWGPVWLPDMMRDISGLGSVIILFLVTTGAGAYLFICKKTQKAIYLIATVFTGVLLSNVLKYAFARPRPELFPHATLVYTASFPSGHSMMAAVVYLTIGVLLAQAFPARALKAYFLGIAVFITLLVGISRIYLNVHWPSDVLAGWVAGALCAQLFWLGERILQKKRRKMD